MKKFKFLVAFFTMLTMFVSFDLIAQEMMPAPKAYTVVANEIETLQKNSYAATANAVQAPREMAVNSLKIVVGEGMLDDLKRGRDVRSTIADSIAKVSSNISERQSIVSEVELFYVNLLRKPF
jgi:hypothetical protein